MKCHRKKRYVNGQKRPMIAKFSINDRDNICSKKGNLKGSNLFIAEDFPLEIEQNRRILLPVFRHARTIESLKGKVSLQVDKLVIDGRTYTVDTLNKLPPSLNPFTYSAWQNETVLVFHGTSSPLANSYPCAFKENGITFNNVEQYMYYHKALTAGDDIAASRMLGIKHVTEQRRLNCTAVGRFAEREDEDRKPSQIWPEWSACWTSQGNWKSYPAGASVTNAKSLLAKSF